ncbi:hypothetical protein K8I61_03495, partial [bacterium]|nr:hypothetical protein [bacterium]
MLCVLCVLFGPVSLACREEPVVPPFSDPIAEFDGVVVLTGAQKASLLDAVRRGLTSELQRPDALLSATPAAGAVLEVWLDGRVACHVAIADGLHVALEQAVAALREDDDFRARVAPKIVDARIKIGVIDRVTRIDIDAEASVPHAARIIAAQFEPGVTGFLLAIGNGHAVLSPDAIVTEGLALDMNQADPVKRRIKRPRLIADLMRRLSREITGKTNAWRSGRLFAFSTQSFIESADTQDGARGAVDLDRGFTTVGDLDNGRLRAAIDANLTYLAGIARNGGTLRYDYDPLTDRETGAYYLPHHAGYVLRHLQAAAMLREPALVDRAMPRLAWLRERIVTPPDAPDVSIVVDGGESLLGTNALMALIFSLLPDAYRQPGDDALRDQFGRAILRFRMDEPGRFYETYAQAAAMSAPKRQPRYFPGVALYALVHLHEATHDDLWLWAAREIGEVLAALWRADGPD